jgi:hypothetical protein
VLLSTDVGYCLINARPLLFFISYYPLTLFPGHYDLSTDDYLEIVLIVCPPGPPTPLFFMKKLSNTYTIILSPPYRLSGK